MLRGIEPFPTKELTEYHPRFLAGWVVERYQIDLLAAAEAGRQKMEAALRSMCASRVPGDTHRNLQVRSRYWNQTFKHILVPIWLLTYQFHARTFQVVLNGYTGAICGDYPKSWIKITFAVLTLLAVIAVIVFLANR